MNHLYWTNAHSINLVRGRHPYDKNSPPQNFIRWTLAALGGHVSYELTALHISREEEMFGHHISPFLKRKITLDSNSSFLNFGSNGGMGWYCLVAYQILHCLMIVRFSIEIDIRLNKEKLIDND